MLGIYDDACEVLFDAEFPGGTDLAGRHAPSFLPSFLPYQPSVGQGACIPHAMQGSPRPRSIVSTRQLVVKQRLKRCDACRRCRGKRGALLPAVELFNLTKQQPITAPAGAAAPKLVLRRGAAAQQVAAAAVEQAAASAEQPNASAEQAGHAGNGSAAAAALRPGSEAPGKWRVEPAPPQSLPMPSASLGFGRVRLFWLPPHPEAVLVLAPPS